jgi:DNA processing protein
MPPEVLDGEGDRACDACLRRGFLTGWLAPRIAGLLDAPASERVAGVLALSDQDLIAATAGDQAATLRRRLRQFDPVGARASLARADVRALCTHQPGYPEQLARLDDAPALLFVRGEGDDRALLGSALVAVVGTRRPSPYGLEVAADVGRGLAAAGLTVVSGLALGIDAQAHRGCLEGGGTPIAVLACGPDIAYPRTNLPVYRRVLERGLVVSELPPGQRPFRWSFPARNRIMAGLAAMTVVVEAAEPSGSLITATFAEHFDRALGAVPGQVTSRLAAGPNRLIADGARLVTGAADVIEELFGCEQRLEFEASLSAPADLDAAGARLLEAVEAGGDVDGLCGRLGLPAREVRSGLARLEGAGLVGRDELGAYHRSAGRR